MVQVSRTPLQPLQNQSSRHLGGCVMPWLAEEMLDGQQLRVDIAAYTRTAHSGLQQKKNNWKRICSELSLMSLQ